MNPFGWEGDNRLYESLASGAMVFCDQLYVDIPDKFIDGKHLIYYNRNNISKLLHQIKYYLQRPKLAENIGVETDINIPTKKP